MLLTGLMSSRRRQRSRGIRRDAQVATAPHAGPDFREIERLESRRLLTVPTAPLFPLDGTGFGQVTGDIVDGAQPELIRFEPVIGGRYVIEQNSNGSGLDSFLRVLDENCIFVASNDDGGPGFDSRLELFVSAGDIFFLEAGSFGASTGAFTLTVTRDDFDSSLSTNGAIVLDQEGNGTIFGEIERTGDQDLFAITSPLTGTLTIQQNDADPGFFNSFVSVFDSSGNFIVSNDDFNGVNSQVEISVSAGEQLLIQASSFDAPGFYQVAVSGDFGDTDLAATPVPVAATGQSFVFGEIDAFNDEDVFQITSPVSGSLLIDLFETDGLFDSFLTVRDGFGTVIAEDDDSGPGLDSQVQVTVSSGDILFIEASEVFGFPGSYGLSILPLADPPSDDFSDDVDEKTATPIALAANGSGSQSGTIGAPGDRDVFRIDATTTGVLTIRLNASPIDNFDLDPLLTVFDQNGSLVAQNDDSGFSLNSRVDVPVTLGQRLLVKASGFGDFSTGDYELTFQALAGGDDDFGNTVPEATRLAFDADGFVLQPGVIEQPDDRDVFSVTAPPGAGTLTIRQVSPDGELDAFLTILDAAGAPIVSNDDSGFSLDSQILLPVTPGEEVFIQAGSFPGSAGSYNLSVQAGDAIADDTGNDNANALTFSLDPIFNNFFTPGTLEVQGDRDVYTTTFDTDGTVQVSLEAASGGFLDTFLRVRNVANDQVAFDDDSGLGLNSQTTVSVSANQQLFFDVGAFADASSGDYFLTVLFQPGVITADDVPINTIDQALPVNPLATVDIPVDGTQVTGNIEVPLDRDVFTFNVPGPSSETVDIRIQQLAAGSGASGFGLDPLLRVFDSSGEQIAFNDDSFFSLNSEVFASVPGGTTILVQAGAFGSSTGAYDLVLDLLDDDFVNTPDGATTFGFDASISGSIEVSGDADVFRIGMPDRTGLPPVEDVRVQVRQTAADGTFDAFLTVFRELDDGSIQFVALNDDSDGLNSVVEFDLKLDANYLVFAEAFGSTTGNYDLSIVDLSQVVVDDDFGNTIENAQGIEVAGLAAIEPVVGNIESTGDVDLFRFTSARNGSAVVELSPGPGLDGRVSVFEINPDVSPDDPEREVRIARSSFTPVSPGGDGLPAITAEFPLILGRQYAIAVDSESGTATGSYTVDLALSDDLVADDGKIPDNVFEAVTALVRAEFAAGTEFDQILERATAEFVSAIGNVGENGFFLFLADPVDFVLADSQNRRVGFTTDQGRVNETPGAQLSQDAPIEVLILPTTDRQFPVQLQGVGSNFQIGGRVVTQAGVLNGSLTTSTGTSSAGSGTLGKNDGNVALVFDFTQNTTPPPPVTPNQRIPQPVDPAPAEVANLIATDADTTAFRFAPGDQIAMAEEAVRAAQDLRDAYDGRQSPDDAASGPNLLQSLIDYLHKSEHEGLRSLGGSLGSLIDSVDEDDSEDDTGVSGSDFFWGVFGGGVMNHLWELGDQIIEQISESDADSESAESPKPDQTQPESTESDEGGKRTGKGTPSQTPQPGSEAPPPSSKETQPAPDGEAKEAAATSQPPKQTSPGSGE